MSIIKVIFVVVLMTVSSSGEAYRTVKLSEKRGVLTQELAETIANMLNNTQEWSVAVKNVGKAVFKQKKTYLMSLSDADLNDHLNEVIDSLRTINGELGNLVYKEKLGKLTKEDVYSFYVGKEETDLVSEHVISSLQEGTSADKNIRDLLQSNWQETRAEWRKLEQVAKIEDVEEKQSVFSDYMAANERIRVENIIILAQAKLEQSDTLSSEFNVESIIKSEYLDDLLVKEMEHLAKLLGRDDLAQMETPIGNFLRISKARIAAEEAAN